MPLYEVEHRIPLSDEQRDQLAESITHIHTTTFCTPSLFVNVRFTDVSKHQTYIGGKRRTANRIVGQLRAGGPRSKADFEKVVELLKTVWDKVVNGGEQGRGEKEMRLVVLEGSIVAGLECGFRLPSAGEDVSWLKEHMTEFEKLAQSGDIDFKELVHETQHREDLVAALQS